MGAEMPNKLQELKEQFDAKQSLASKVLEQAGEDLDFAKVDCLGPNLDTQAKVDAFRGLNDELADIQLDIRATSALLEGQKSLKNTEDIRDMEAILDKLKNDAR